MLKIHWLPTYLAFTLILIAACLEPTKPTQSADRDAILKLHQDQRRYHFQKDSIAFADQLSDDFISVNRGIISQPRPNETIRRYNNYFSNVEFIKWDDVTPPIIRFSDDGQMAYTIVDKIVSVTYEAGDSTTVLDSTHFAWTAIYSKHDGEWKIDCVTSTERKKSN